MGFQSISVYNATPLFQTLAAEGQTDSPVFAMKLVASGSELSLGGLNSDLYTGNVAYVPVIQQGYWQTTLRCPQPWWYTNCRHHPLHF
jgi:cathepsin D